MRRTKSHHKASAWKGIVAGIAGGIAGTIVMSAIQSRRIGKPMLSQKYHKDLSHLGQPPGRNHIRISSHPAVQEVLGERLPEPELEYPEPAAVAVAAAVSETVFRHHMNEKELSFAAPATQYMVGTTLGAAYGVAAEFAPHITTGKGAAMGAGLAVAKEELLKPSLGLSANPFSQPVAAHVFELWTHVVYGLTCEAVRRLVRAVL